MSFDLIVPRVADVRSIELPLPPRHLRGNHHLPRHHHQPELRRRLQAEIGRTLGRILPRVRRLHDKGASGREEGEVGQMLVFRARGGGAVDVRPVLREAARGSTERGPGVV